MATVEPYELPRKDKDGKPLKPAVRYRVRHRTPEGRQTDKRGFRTKREAEAFRNTVEVSKLKGEYVNPSDARRTVDTLGEDWLARQKGHLKPSGYKVMETAWRLKVKPRWGHVALGDIRPSAVEGWLAELREGSEGVKPIKPATIKRAHHVLSSILGDAVRDNLIPKNPAAGLSLPRTSRRKHVYLTHAQVSALAAAAGEHEALVLLLAYTGLRPSEAAGLRVHDLNALRRRITVAENAVQAGGEIHRHLHRGPPRHPRLRAWNRCRVRQRATAARRRLRPMPPPRLCPRLRSPRQPRHPRPTGEGTASRHPAVTWTHHRDQRRHNRIHAQQTSNDVEAQPHSAR